MFLQSTGFKLFPIIMGGNHVLCYSSFNPRSHLKYDSHTANICFIANQKLSALGKLASLFTFDKKRILFKAFFDLNLSIIFWLGCFVTEGPITELINYMNVPKDLYMMITKPCSRTCLQKLVHLPSIIQIFKHSYLKSKLFEGSI